VSDDSPSNTSSTHTASPLPAAEKPAALPPGEAPFRPLSEQKTVISKRPPLSSPRLPVPLAVEGGEKSLLGQRLGHFELLEFIGGGGMGVVFRALDTTLGRTVAVKVVSNDNTDEETLRRFRNEAQSAARLDHPNIARVYYVGEDQGWNYIVFEYIDGINIRDMVERKGPLSVDEAVSYTLQVAEALAHAGERDVVHRDIKPSNILVMPDGRAKLVDMGLARLHQVESPTNDLTATGVTLGTFDYISPEQARDPRLADARSDLYSLGCTFYFMLTGLPPFPEGTVLQKLLSHSSEPPPDPRDIRSDLPEEVANVALKLMSKQPGQRQQHPNELVGELLLLADHLGLAVANGGGKVWLSTRETWTDRLERHLPWLIPLLLLIGSAYGFRWLQDAEPITRAEMAVTRPDAATAAPQIDTGEAATPSPAEAAPEEPPSPAPAAIPAVPPAALPAKPGQEVNSTPNGGDINGSASLEVPLGDSDTVAEPEPIAEREDLLPQTAVASPSEDKLEVPPAATLEIDSTQEISRRDVPAELPAPAEIERVLIVRPSATGDEPHVKRSLQTALQEAADSTDVSTIELQFDQLVVDPLTIHLHDDRDVLTIRAGNGFNPLLVFRPEAASVAAERRMLNLIDGRIHFSGVHFRAELPGDAMADGWSLFHLNHMNEVRLARCTMTVHNQSFSPAAFFEIHGPRGGGMARADGGSSGDHTPKIRLDSCVARGQATLVRAIEGLPFWLTWFQGLLTTTDYLAEVSGRSDRSKGEAIRIALRHVTASMDAGMVRLGVRESAPLMFDVGIDSSNCVFVHDTTNPLIGYYNIADPIQVARRFEFSGSDNFYDFTEIRWRIIPADEMGEILEFLWEDKEPSWYLEKRAERGLLRWRSPLPGSRTAHLHTPSQYLLDDSYSLAAGFDINEIPLPPEP
jgi:serine/threonine-protein kinase